MTEEEFRGYCGDELRMEQREVDARMTRLNAVGCSMHGATGPGEDECWLNRAGEEETWLTRAQLLTYLKNPTERIRGESDGRKKTYKRFMGD
jgi:hypothetical protein